MLAPVAAVGHSAGAAVALRMRLDGMIGEGEVVAVNGALAPFGGAAFHDNKVWLKRMVS